MKYYNAELRDALSGEIQTQVISAKSKESADNVVGALVTNLNFHGFDRIWVLQSMHLFYVD